MAGRTSWWSRDAATHDRELIVELGDEYGSAGPYVDTVLRDLAQQQQHSGHVRTGFRSLARKVFCEPEKVREIVEAGASIGLFDELEIDEDGRRFSLRVSGWDADSQTGTEAIRKRVQRAVSKELEQTDPPPEGLVPKERDKSRSVPLTRPDQTINTPPIPPKGERTNPGADDLKGTPFPRTPSTGRKRDAEREQLEWLKHHVDELGHIPRREIEDLATYGRLVNDDGSFKEPTAENILAEWQRLQKPPLEVVA